MLPWYAEEVGPLDTSEFRRNPLLQAQNEDERNRRIK